MTVSTTGYSSGPFTGNGATTVFPFTFDAGTTDEVEVLEDGAVVTTGFTITLNSGGEGGNVTYSTAPATGVEILIRSDVSFLQDVALTNNGAWLPEVIEGAFDQCARRDIYIYNRLLAIPEIDIQEQAESARTNAVIAAFAAIEADEARDEAVDAAEAAVQSENNAAMYATAAAADGALIYANTADGLAATASGGYFYVAGTGDTSLILYLDNAGVAEEKARFASLAAFADAVTVGGNLERSTINLYHDDNTTDDARLEADGSELFAANTFITDYLEVLPDTTYSLWLFSDDTTGHAADSNSTALTSRWHSYTSADVLVQPITVQQDTFTTGPTETKIRLSGPNILHRSRIMLVAGLDQPGIYSDFHTYSLITDRRAGPVILPERRKYDDWTWAVISDSLGAQSDHWWSHMAPRLGFFNSPWYDSDGSIPVLDRYMIGGSSVEERPFYGVEAFIDHTDTHFWQRVQDIDHTREVLYIQGGTNGWGSHHNPAVALSKANPATVGDFEEQWALFRANPLTVDGTTTWGAHMLLCYYAVEAYPDAPIRFIGPPPRVAARNRINTIGSPVSAQDYLDYVSTAVDFPGIDLYEYSEIQKAVCRLFGIPYFDSLAMSQLRPWNATNLALNYIDDVHLSPNGQRLWGGAILEWELGLGTA